MGQLCGEGGGLGYHIRPPIPSSIHPPVHPSTSGAVLGAGHSSDGTAVPGEPGRHQTDTPGSAVPSPVTLLTTHPGCDFAAKINLLVPYLRLKLPLSLCPSLWRALFRQPTCAPGPAGPARRPCLQLPSRPQRTPLPGGERGVRKGRELRAWWWWGRLPPAAQVGLPR